MIFLIGIVLVLTLSTIQAGTPTIPELPKILPDDAPYVNNTVSKNCSSDPFCGYVRYSQLQKELGVVHLHCTCPENQQCEYDEPSLVSHTAHLYNCTDKPSVLRPIGWSV